MGLPLRKWYFILLGVPTFYMPLAYLGVAVWPIVGMLAGEIKDPPELFMRAVHPALYVTFGMWPIYIAWVGLSKRLARREKAWWLFIVVILNMAGMPMFYVFMIRRYFGLEGRTGVRDKAAVERFLDRHAISRDHLSSGQLDALRTYCRKYRLSQCGIIPMVAAAALMLYTAVAFVPKNCVRLLSDFAPTRVLIVDSETEEKKEIALEAETIKLHVQNVMMFGAMAGMAGAMGIFILAQALSQLWGNWHRKALIEFLKATEREHLTSRTS